MSLPSSVLRRTLFLAVLSLSLTSGWWYHQMRQDKEHLKKQISNFLHISRNTLDGESSSLNDIKKDYLLINYWASWCVPCREELPILDEFFEIYKNKIYFLGIALDQRSAVVNFLKHYPIGYPVVLAQNDDLNFLKVFGNQSQALPFSLLLTKEEIVFFKLGKLTRHDLKEWVDTIKPSV